MDKKNEKILTGKESITIDQFKSILQSTDNINDTIKRHNQDQSSHNDIRAEVNSVKSTVDIAKSTADEALVLAGEKVTTDRIADAAVTEAKLSADVQAKLNATGGGGTVADGSITTEKIADGAVTSVKLAYPLDNFKTLDFTNEGDSILKGATAIYGHAIFGDTVEFNQGVQFHQPIDASNIADGTITKSKLASDITIPDIEYSQTDLEAGVSELAAGKLYFVYE